MRKSGFGLWAVLLLVVFSVVAGVGTAFASDEDNFANKIGHWVGTGGSGTGVYRAGGVIGDIPGTVSMNYYETDLDAVFNQGKMVTVYYGPMSGSYTVTGSVPGYGPVSETYEESEPGGSVPFTIYSDNSVGWSWVVSSTIGDIQETLVWTFLSDTQAIVEGHATSSTLEVDFTVNVTKTSGPAPTPTPTPTPTPPTPDPVPTPTPDYYTLPVLVLRVPYDGLPHTPVYMIIDPYKKKALVEGVDYDVVSGGEAQTEAGSYPMMFTCKGEYIGWDADARSRYFSFVITKRPESADVFASASALASSVNSGSFGLHAAADGGTVTITNGGSVSSGAVMAAQGGDIALDTAPGMTIVWKASLAGSSSGSLVSVKGGGDIKISGGSIINGADGGTALYSEGDVSVESGLVLSNGAKGTTISSLGDVAMTGGRVSASGAAASAAIVNGRFDFSGGVVTSGGKYGIGIFAANGAAITGGAVSAGQSGAAVLSLAESGVKFDGGIMTNGSRGEAKGSAFLNGDYEVPFGVTLYVPNGAVVTNRAETAVNGTIKIEPGGKFENRGKITGAGSVENNGELNNYEGASVNVSVSGNAVSDKTSQGSGGNDGGGGCDNGALGLLGCAAVPAAAAARKYAAGKHAMRKR